MPSRPLSPSLPPAVNPVPEIWIGPYDAILSPASFEEIHQGFSEVKPRGGLWTSPDQGESSAWSSSDAFQSYRDPEYSRWRLYPAPSAQIFTVDSQAAADYLLNRFPYPRPKSHPDLPLLDWQALAEHYDAVRLDAAGLAAPRLSATPFAGWDVPTTLWFHWAFTEISLLERNSAAPPRTL